MRHLLLLSISLFFLMISCELDEGDDPNIDIPTGTALVINEFLAKNDAVLADENEEFDDWVEIYNGTDTDVDLGGYWFSDDHEEPLQIPTGSPEITTVQAGGFIIIWFDDTPDQGPLHIEYKLGSGGDGVFMYDIDGSTVIDSYTFGPQEADISEGRNPDGADNWRTFSSPTPGASNN